MPMQRFARKPPFSAPCLSCLWFVEPKNGNSLSDWKIFAVRFAQVPEPCTTECLEPTAWTGTFCLLIWFQNGSKHIQLIHCFWHKFNGCTNLFGNRLQWRKFLVDSGQHSSWANTTKSFVLSGHSHSLVHTPWLALIKSFEPLGIREWSMDVTMVNGHLLLTMMMLVVTMEQKDPVFCDGQTQVSVVCLSPWWLWTNNGCMMRPQKTRPHKKFEQKSIHFITRSTSLACFVTD